ncbi:hypothetical protein VXE32_003684 [Burkholderia cepacia]|nr:hypothetical protein [Burkholderia cepacia]
MPGYLDTIPHPWTRDIIETAIFRNFTDARESIEMTPGGVLWRALQDLQDTIWIFETNTTELLDEICLFGERSKNPAFWHPAKHSEVKNHTRAVKKKIFHCTSSLMTLVDHARKFHRSTPVSGYYDRLKAVFSSPGLHDFLQCFRNYNTHWRIAEANWLIQRDKSGRSAKFVIKKSELLIWDGWTRPAREYIEASEEILNVYDIFSEYRSFAQKFYAWHRGAVFDTHPDIIRYYLECKRLYEGLQKKYMWNMIISHTPKTLNPFEYVDQYLTENQLQQLLAHELRSSQQVDALIRMLDMEEFCDQDLRSKVTAFFRRDESA